MGEGAGARKGNGAREGMAFIAGCSVAPVARSAGRDATATMKKDMWLCIVFVFLGPEAPLVFNKVQKL